MTTRGAHRLRARQPTAADGAVGTRRQYKSKLGEVDFGPQALIDLRGEELRWFDRYSQRQGSSVVEATRSAGAPLHHGRECVAR